MRSTWKALVVGGVTGVAAGIAIDALTGVSDRARPMGRTIVDQAPIVADRVADATERGVSKIRDADLSGKADDVLRSVAHQLI